MKTCRREPQARSMRVGILVILASLLIVSPATGQAPGTSYLLGPGDALEVTVWGWPDLTREVTVRPDGRITLPVVGTVTAAGLSPERLAQSLTRAYAVYIVDPKVAVIIKQFRRIRVSIVGQVARPGTYELVPESRLLDLLAIAGGVTDSALLREAQLLHPGQPPVIVNLERVLAGDPQVNVLLRGEETLVILEDLVNLVHVFGEVARPGRYRLKGQPRVLDGLLLAGGLTERASLVEARLLRSNVTQSLHLDALLLRQDMSLNIELRPGDTLLIPEDTGSRVHVIGDVRNPGVFPVKGRVTLLQALALAGGPVQRGLATATTVHIIRRTGEPERVVAGLVKVDPVGNGGALMTVDLRTLMQPSNVTKEVTIQPGDVLVVPQTGLSALSLVLNILSGIVWPFMR